MYIYISIVVLRVVRYDDARRFRHKTEKPAQDCLDPLIVSRCEAIASCCHYDHCILLQGERHA